MRTPALAFAACVLLSARAHAQGVTVNDPASIFQEAQQVAQQAKSYLLQAQQFATQAQQLNTALQELQAFVHAPSLGAAGILLNQAGVGNSLPVSPMAVAALINGTASINSLSGLLGQLSGLSNLIGTNYATNHIYSPTDGSWASRQLIANGNSIAAVEGQQQAVYQDLRNHLPVLQALVTRLQSASNPKDVADAQAQIAGQVAWTNNLQAELASIDANYRAQQDARAQRSDEAVAQSFDNFISAANALPAP